MTKKAQTTLALLLAVLPALAHGETKPSPAPAPQPAAEPPAKEAGPPAPSSGPDVDSLRKEYDSLREGLFTSRARAAAVGDALYSAKLQIALAWRSGRFQAVRRASIRLDGASVFDDPEGVIAENDAPRFEGFVAPGTHVVTIRIEAAARDDDRFVTTLENTFTVEAVAGRILVLRAKAEDTGNLGYNWKKKQKGSYKLRLDVDVDTQPRKDQVKRTEAKAEAKR